MTWTQDDVGTSSSQPREGIAIVAGVQVFRISTGQTDVTIGGEVFEAVAASRGEITLPTIGANGELQITLATSHPLVALFTGSGLPPQQASVTVHGHQVTSAESKVIWRGFITGMQCNGPAVTINAISRLGNVLQRKLPTITVGRQCPHILYDENCRVDRPPYTRSTFITLVNGRNVTVANLGGEANQWAKYGEIEVVATGQRMLITSQVGTALTLYLPLTGVVTGTSVKVYAGCDRKFSTCDQKFDNRENFGGFPQLPRGNPFRIGGGFGAMFSWTIT